MRDVETPYASSIVYDETPIHVYMTQIKDHLAAGNRLAFRELFRPGMSKSALVGVFLAILELVRHDHARTEQNTLFAEFWIVPGPAAASDVQRR